MSADPTTPWALLRGRAAHDGARPVLTFRDEATAERVELSGTTLENWVAKTAGLLQQELGAGPGSLVSLAVPPHWQGVVWVLSAWAVGARVRAGGPAGADVAVVGPDSVQEAVAASAGEVVALSLRPLAGRFVEALPAMVRDFAVEVPAMPDAFAPWSPVGPEAVALDVAGRAPTQGELLAQARDLAAARGVGSADRVLVDADPATPVGAVRTALLPLVSGAAAVLVRHADPARAAHRAVEEGLTVDLTS